MTLFGGRKCSCSESSISQKRGCLLQNLERTRPIFFHNAESKTCLEGCKVCCLRQILKELLADFPAWQEGLLECSTLYLEQLPLNQACAKPNIFLTQSFQLPSRQDQPSHGSDWGRWEVASPHPPPLQYCHPVMHFGWFLQVWILCSMAFMIVSLFCDDVNHPGSFLN